MKRMVIASAVLLVLGLTTGLVKEAEATCPPPTGYKSIGGACYYVNGVVVKAFVYNSGNLNKNMKSFNTQITTVVAPPYNGGMLFCANSGGNQPPGQRIIPVAPSLGCTVLSNETNADCTDLTNPDATTDCWALVSSKNGGTSNVVCDATVTADDLAKLGQQFCSSGQFAIDFVPCEFDSTVTYSDRRGTITSAQHHCSLPSCDTLRWDNKAGMPEFREYECLP